MICLMDTLIEGITSRICPVNTMAGRVQCLAKIMLYRIKFIQFLNGFPDHRSQIVKIIHFFIQPGKICSGNTMFLRCRYPAAFQAGPKAKGYIHICTAICIIEKYFFVIGIHALIHLTIQVQHGLKSGIITGTCITKIKNTYNFLSFPLSRYLNHSMHPQKKITSFPCIPYTQCIPSCKDFRQYRIHNSLSIFLYCKFIEIYNISISVFFQFCNSPFQFSIG